MIISIKKRMLLQLILIIFFGKSSLASLSCKEILSRSFQPTNFSEYLREQPKAHRFLMMHDPLFLKKSKIKDAAHVKARDFFENQLNKDELNELLLYHSSEGFQVNVYLRTGENNLNYGATFDLNTFLSATEKIPSYKGVVFRGLRVPLSSFENIFIEGGIFSDQGILSTSENFHVATDFQKLKIQDNEVALFMVIRSLTGKSIGALESSYNREGEVIFNPNTRFKISSILKVSQKSRILFMDELI